MRFERGGSELQLGSLTKFGGTDGVGSELHQLNLNLTFGAFCATQLQRRYRVFWS